MAVRERGLDGEEPAAALAFAVPSCPLGQEGADDEIAQTSGELGVAVDRRGDRRPHGSGPPVEGAQAGEIEAEKSITVAKILRRKPAGG
ncbi:hypothetical protein OV079_39610 [Nannocystis pusilla]|uniref:Uncharacterized protein n=1 Tax=Nannocystis pusilla TaxID=889268 RepID=A0A9X3EXW5_9BACT|nr:hypothetical protein [Nannocystis pusilla]MCY1011570.1 hypothetical protein [Nannocystis pusilla]